MLRYATFAATIVLALASLVGLSLWPGWWGLFVPLAVVFGALAALGVRDLIQPRHAVLRNYPVLGHMRWIFEGIRPEIRQYLIESDQDEALFSRETRSLAYQRAKGVEDKRPFGTRKQVYEAGYSWFSHSVAPIPEPDWDMRVTIGGPDCRQPYSASIYNISAMSFGALSANAILALSRGAAMGGFAHDTGEGGISRWHRQGGGDLIYEIGTGYFGCRDAEGRFDPDRFAEQAGLNQVKMVEVKLSQGAKPGHGGILPAAKITAEIAEARGIPMNRDCVSPPGHSAFSTPVEFAEFLGRLRDLSGGKPVGFKLCIGQRREFMCLVKGMLATGIYPDFVVVDGAEGGTGAAPLEFSNHVGMPMIEGLRLVHTTLCGAGLRGRIRIGAAGKLITAFDILRTLALGADWCNSARGFMFSVGCIQAQACHTNHCPTGVTTQDPWRQRALNVADKSVRAANFHRNTLKAVADLMAAAGLDRTDRLTPEHVNVRQLDGTAATAAAAYRDIPEGSLVSGDCPDEALARIWGKARAETFAVGP